MNREQAKRIAEETLSILQTGGYQRNGATISIREDIKKSVAQTVLYEPNHQHVFHLPSQTHQTVIECTSETSLQAAYRLHEEGHPHICCLNFASAKHPGGGFLNGSRAQEESLARSSALYATIAPLVRMYEHNLRQKSGFYSDYMAFSPFVPVFRKDNGELLENPYHVSFITSAAVNAGVVREREAHRKNEIEKVMKNRMRCILSVAKANKQEVLVLGAFGCGVFKNNVHTVSRLFKELLDEDCFSSSFRKIVFAVYERDEKRPFLHAFKQRFRV